MPPKDRCREEHRTALTAAGWWVYVQDVENGPIVSRKQYTTDPSDDRTAEASLVMLVDSYQMDVRSTVRPTQGVNNLTPDMVDRVRLVFDAITRRYTNRSALKGVVLNSLEPSTTPGDLTTMLADVTFSFYGPFNDLRVRIIL